MSVTGLIFASAGSPDGYGEPMTGACRLCGAEADRGMPWERWVKDTFVDHDKLQPGTMICAACLFCVDDHNVTLQQMTGRDKLQRMRNYSHIVAVDGSWSAYMKNQKREIATALLANPRAAVISFAGQKHLLFRGRVGWWQIEEQAMRPDPARLAALLEPITALYTAGASKTEIGSGHYTAATLSRMEVAWWHARESQIRPHRGSLIFELAVWLAQKDEEGVDGDGADLQAGARRARPAVARARSGIQGKVLPHDLDADGKPGAQRRLHDDAESLVQSDLFTAAD